MGRGGRPRRLLRRENLDRDPFAQYDADELTELLREHDGLTTVELAERTGANYETTRSRCLTLEDEDRIQRMIYGSGRTEELVWYADEREELGAQPFIRFTSAEVPYPSIGWGASRRCMAHNESARQRAAQGCPECGADGRDVVARTVEKVYGGEDWERVECSACGWSRTM